MILVPAELSERLQPQQSKVIGSRGVSRTLDGEMSDILSDKKLSDESKWRKYSAALNRYMHFVNENRKPLELPIISSSIHRVEEEQEKEEHSPNAVDSIRNTLLAVIPKKFINSATIIYDQLSLPHARSIISWDENGLVSVSGTPLAGSNIIDLVSDLTRFRKSFNPEGWQTFATALAELHLPADLIGNKKYETIIRGQSGAGSTPPWSAPHRPAPPRTAPRHPAPPRTAPHRPARRPAPRHSSPGRPSPRHSAAGRSAPRPLALKTRQVKRSKAALSVKKLKNATRRSAAGASFVKWSKFRF